ncbi:MAG: serine/threonine protein kinase [Verrucomicrobiales bacterium]|jgi:serine/threonine protein kinase
MFTSQMADDSQDPGKSGPLRRALEIDAICDRFEAEAQAGDTPEIRLFLDEVETEARAELFQQLLGLQISIVVKPEDRPGLPSLLSEYPEFTNEILKVVSGQPSVAETIRTRPPSNVGAEAVLGEIQPEQRYRLEGEVARGGMGAIHLAEDPALRRRVAVKTMLSPQASTDELVRFIEEAQITGQLDHPGIVPVHELGVDESGKPFYSMKFVRGRDLQTILEGLRNGDAALAEEFPLHRLLNILDRICDAVGFAHAHGVLHRDLKPANLRIGEFGEFGEVLVMDWGLAKILGKEDSQAKAEIRAVESIRGADETVDFHTLAGSVMGSPQYMAPEQASGATHELDEGADIYALGAILYEILTLRSPIDMKSGEDIIVVLERVAAGEITSPRSTKKRPVPEALSKVAMKALALRRADRYANVGELQGEIDAWLGGFATEAENAGLLRQIRLFVQRNKIASAAAAIIALVLAAATGLSLYQRDIAISAYNDLDESEREKAEQRRNSAPAYLKAALALETQDDFDNALITLEQALEFDPDLIEAQRARALLLARAGRIEEAEKVAWGLPMERADQQLLDVLKLILEEPDANHLPKLAKLATAVGMAATSTDLWAQSAKRFEVIYAEALPTWREKLKNAWSERIANKLKIDPELGLALELGIPDKETVTSLGPLRGIPIKKLDLVELNISDLTPLREMRLRWLKLVRLPILSLEGVENAPLEQLRINYNAGVLDRTFLAPLIGREFEFLSLGTASKWVDTEVLSEIQCRSLHLSRPNSMAFIRDQKNLESLRLWIDPTLFDGDWSPVFESKTLTYVEGHRWVNRATVPIWSQIASGELEAAGMATEKLKNSIQNPACNPTRELLALMQFLIDRKLGKPTSLVDVREQIAPVGDGRVFVSILLDSSIHLFEIQLLKAFKNLDVEFASIHSTEEQTLAHSLGGGVRMATGGFRTKKDLKWRWRDDSPWDFDRFGEGEADKPILGTRGTQAMALEVSGYWTAIDHGFGQAYRLLIQFPAEWLQGGN